MLTMAEDDWSFVRVIATDTFKNRRTVMQSMGHNAYFRFFPFHHLAIEPDKVSFLRHSSFLGRLCADLLCRFLLCCLSLNLNV